MRNLVICCDGTGNEISENISNVLKFYRCLRKTDKTTPPQLVYYSSGVGTLSAPNTWHRLKTAFNAVLGLATGYGLDDSVLEAYRFLVMNYRSGDQIYLFGFSRGAYTVRVLAGLIHKVGLITPEQVNLADSSLLCYKQYSGLGRGNDLSDLKYADADEQGPLPQDSFDLAAQFARITSSRWPTVRFIGVWDTVASMIVPRRDILFPAFSLEELAFTLRNPSVKTFRQAIAIDERRRMFRLKTWDEPQEFWSNRFLPGDRKEPQDTLQVWFAGTHGDIGGGYPESESSLSKFPLLWMIDEAAKAGLSFNPRTVNQLAWGVSRKNSPFRYVSPDFMGDLHDSLSVPWRLLEFQPKSAKYKEWPARTTLTGFYIPDGEPRLIPEGAYLHESVLKRIDVLPDYRPVNLPAHFEVAPLPMRDQQEVPRLESLFLALFDETQIERFARQLLGPRIGQTIQSTRSKSLRAKQLASELEIRGRVDHDLFDQLTDAQPDQKNIIDDTRAALLGKLPEARKTAPAPERTVEFDDEIQPSVDPQPQQVRPSTREQAWRDSLEDLLESTSLTQEDPPTRWIEAASVQPDFDPLQLQKHETINSHPNALTQLAAISDVRPDGRWTLQLRPRREAIARLWKETRLLQVLTRTAEYDQPPSSSIYRSILTEIATKERVKVEARAGYEWMVAARDIADWFSASGHQPFDLDRLDILVERYETTEPLRKLVGRHFRGRAHELEVLRSHQRGDSADKPVLKISGIGGAGKSALLGKILLDFEVSNGIPLPWVYLDFDHPNVQLENPARLIELIARRLGLLYWDQSGERLFHRLESISAGDLIEVFDLAFKYAGTDELIEELDRVIRSLQMGPSLFIVFDTFEQAQVQGRTKLRQFIETIEKLLAKLPYVRIVLSGRGPIEAFPDATLLPVDDLDDQSADEVLQALGVDDENIRAQIMRAVGTSPLSLNLAAAALKAGRLDFSDPKLFDAGARSVDIQGRLYTRFLGHITDAAVKRLAHPGLIVRRVTPGIIRDVLATICEIRPESAQELFDKLSDHVALFEPDPDEVDALRHRQDIREAMIELMIRDPIWKDRLPLIHDKAIEHYSGRPDAIARAEELYHRLMRNDDLAELDKLWSEELAASLGRSWLEPFPKEARAWLALRLGRDVLRAPESLRQPDWEVYAAGEVNTHILNNELWRALDVLGERSERIANSPLFPLQAEVLRRLGRLKDALDVCHKGLALANSIDNSQARLALYILAAEIALELIDFDLSRRHAYDALNIANDVGSRLDELRAREVLARGELVLQREPGDRTTDAVLDLVAAFLRTSAEILQLAPDVTARIVKTLGSRSGPVLSKAASTFGNRPDQMIVRTDAFRLAELLGRVGLKSNGVELLKSLAVSVGLPRNELDVQRIADSSVSFNRQGDVVAAILDAFGNDEDIRTAAADMFF